MKLISPMLLAAVCGLTLLTTGCETTAADSSSGSNAQLLTYTFNEEGNLLFRDSSGKEVMIWGEDKEWPFKVGKKYLVTTKRKTVTQEVGLDVLTSDAVVIDTFKAVD